MSMQGGRQGWTQHQVDDLIRLHTMGYSAGMIATTIGLSRSAVVGRAWRMGLRFTATEHRKDSMPSAVFPPGCDARLRRMAEAGMSIAAAAKVLGVLEKQAQRRASLLGISFAKRRYVSVTRAAAGRAEPYAPPGAVSFFAVRAGQCRWPFGDPSDLAAFRFCGAGVDHPGSSYCACHRAAARTTLVQAAKENAARQDAA